MKIEIREYTKRFGKLTALEGISLTIEPGAIVAVLGANGSGKTTLLRCLSGIAASPHGEILYDGQRFDRECLETRRRFMYLPDFPATFGGWTPLRQIAMALRVYRRAGIPADGLGSNRAASVNQAALGDAAERVTELFRALDLLPLAERPIELLSRGQQYKVFLTALAAVDPEVWLLDEPFASGMDPQGIQVFKEEAAAATRRGRTVLYTTQILDVVERFSDQVCVLHKAKVAASGSLERLRLESGEGDRALEAIFKRLREEPDVS